MTHPLNLDTWLECLVQKKKMKKSMGLKIFSFQKQAVRIFSDLFSDERGTNWGAWHFAPYFFSKSYPLIVLKSEKLHALSSFRTSSKYCPGCTPVLPGWVLGVWGYRGAHSPCYIQVIWLGGILEYNFLLGGVRYLEFPGVVLVNWGSVSGGDK